MAKCVAVIPTQNKIQRDIQIQRNRKSTGRKIQQDVRLPPMGCWPDRLRVDAAFGQRSDSVGCDASRSSTALTRYVSPPRGDGLAR
jgi:hypothetical protein